jgi:N utilization substance protein B
MSRKLTREIIMNTVYQMEIHENYEINAFKAYLEDNIFDEPELRFATLVIKAFEANRDTVDERIKENLKSWTIDRISKVVLSILRVAVTEILYIDELSAAISINEAVNLAKKFSDEESAVFVNGVLGELQRQVESSK